MTTTQTVNKEAIRILVADVGYEETAKRTGIRSGTLRQWALRGKWNVIRSHAQDTVTTVTSPGDAHAEILAERKQESATHLSRYIVDASNNLAKSKGKLKNARVARDIVAARSGVWPEERQGESGLTLNLLNLVIPAESARRSAHEDE